MVHVIDSCPAFGWSFDGEHPMCTVCKSAPKCFDLSRQDKMKRKMGYTPKIPYARQKKLPQVYVSRPTVQNDKWVQITLRFDLEWLRKHIESEDKAES